MHGKESHKRALLTLPPTTSQMLSHLSESHNQNGASLRIRAQAHLGPWAGEHCGNGKDKMRNPTATMASHGTQDRFHDLILSESPHALSLGFCS